MEKRMNRKIVLENGTQLIGSGFGANNERVCEIVFNTSMAGYQEIISDLSYADQAVVMSYPLIGNYGITDEDFESRTPLIGGLIVRECNDSPSNFRYTKTLSEYLYDNSVPGIAGLDTRRIVRTIRDEGSQKVLITDSQTPLAECMEKINDYTLRHDAVRRASCLRKWYSRTTNPQYNVVAVDCGIKLNIIRMLNRFGCNVTVVPYNTTAKEIMKLKPDGLFLSNGPGDPEDVTEVAELVKTLCGRLPIFGICLGHQIIALAHGAETYKLKFGHRGGNHPVKNLLTGKIEITSQNHSYAVKPEGLEKTTLTPTHINLLDNTIEGAQCISERIFSVQYHPESAPGPQDSTYLFKQFTDMMKEARENA